ncbi:MAG TPA: thiol-activated cytolysin family protein [Kofleriaceae bacterium]|nr:thiol-activated cytolysin family protein [Kofleriaceae bacterium]
MKTSHPILLCSFGLLAACAAQSPGGDDGPPDPVETSDDPIDQVIAKTKHLVVDAPKVEKGAPGAPMTDGDYQCVDTPVQEVRQYDQLLGQLNIGDVLWPGAILRGDSVYSGHLTPITLPRAPETFSVSLESLAGGAHSATLDSPSLSSYRDAIGKILAQSLSGSTAARLSSEVDEVNSEKELALALGVDASAPLTGSIKAGFNFSDSTKRSRYIVKFYQLYYTVDVDPPNLPHDFFAPGVTAADVEGVVSAENPPVYVSSIGYGRQVIFTFESDLAKSELKAALEFAYKGGPEISGNTSLTHQEVLSHTHTTAFILGGDAGEAAQVAIGTYDQLKQFIAHGGNYSKDSPGAAIAYKLSYVRDHDPVQISYASDYTEHTCSRVTQKLRVVLEKIKTDSSGLDGGGDLEIYGSVTAVGTTRQTLVNWASSQYKTIADGVSFPSSGTLGEAILSVKPAAGQAVKIETSLMESDQYVNSDDSFGTAVQDSAPFESGWRRSLILHRSSGDQAITLQLSLTPVP